VAPAVYQFPRWALALLALLIVGGLFVFWDSLRFMLGQWHSDEFSHGFVIPFISLFLIWQRRTALQSVEFKGSWIGLIWVLAGLAIEVIGRLSTLFVIQHVALLVVIWGLALSLTGWAGLRFLRVPLGILVFMVPLPIILLNSLSSELQLISSSIGVWLIRLAGVAVFLEGNVIDLGSYKLEVAEACSGLRYLLPLMTLSFLMACFFNVQLWKRIVLFLSSIPITLLMNSLRIAAIGVMVDHWGASMAEGLLHEVQGWMMFMLSIGILLMEIMLLSRIGPDRRPWRQVFGLDLPAAHPANLPRRRRVITAPLLASAAALLLFCVFAASMPARSLEIPERETFVSFPMQVAQWKGTREALDRVYLDQLKLDDYLMANFAEGGAHAVNFYVAWYDTQSAGEATHSPRACLPGGGWRIRDLHLVTLNEVSIGNQPLEVNRALIEYGDQQELVYYWFLQRGRVVTNEYLVKWYLLVDALLRHRTDGALVRLIVPISAGMTTPDADRELRSFAAAVSPRLIHFVPS
jgi:exosortase D (VPLPA-CTERM-specific)